MFMLKFLFVFGVFAVILRGAQAVSSEEKEKFQAATSSSLLSCGGEFGVSRDEIFKVQKSDAYSNLDPCIIACVFRSSNMIDDKGLYDALKAEEFVQKFLSVEADKTKASGIISKCRAVNVHEVNDGEKGCERAKMLFECFGPLKAMFAN